jgi:hypothetical protein
MAKRIVIENQRRDRLHIPVDAAAASVPGVIEGYLVVGDKMDIDDKVPEQGRNEHLQPHPRRVLTAQQYDSLGELAHRVIEDQVRQGRLQKTELAA